MNIRHFVSAIAIFAAGCVITTVMSSKSLIPAAKSSGSAVAAQVTQKPSTTQLWEYRILTKHKGDKKVDLEQEVSSLGEQGFEVGWVTQSSAGPQSGFYLTIVLRRPK
jgi:hypothetical protein